MSYGNAWRYIRIVRRLWQILLNPFSILRLGKWTNAASLIKMPPSPPMWYWTRSTLSRLMERLSQRIHSNGRGTSRTGGENGIWLGRNYPFTGECLVESTKEHACKASSPSPPSSGIIRVRIRFFRKLATALRREYLWEFGNTHCCTYSASRNAGSFKGEFQWKIKRLFCECHGFSRKYISNSIDKKWIIFSNEMESISRINCTVHTRVISFIIA